MAESLTGFSISAKLAATLQNEVDGALEIASVPQGVTFAPETRLTSGTTANKADRMWQDRSRALAGAATESLNVSTLTGIDIGVGAGKDALGLANAFVEIVGLLIWNKAASVGNLLVGGEGSADCWNSLFNADDDAKLVIKPGGMIAVFAPTDPAYAVAAGNNLLKLEASGGNVAYDIVILGRSA